LTLLLYEKEMSATLKKKKQGDQIAIAQSADNVVHTVMYIKSETELKSIFQ